MVFPSTYKELLPGLEAGDVSVQVMQKIKIIKYINNDTFIKISSIL
tara:strand:- start:6389 stop:6526 length:138 start_codon:yes stop_codon:yes gene_type:complete